MGIDSIRLVRLPDGLTFVGLSATGETLGGSVEARVAASVRPRRERLDSGPTKLAHALHDGSLELPDGRIALAGPMHSAGQLRHLAGSHLLAHAR